MNFSAFLTRFSAFLLLLCLALPAAAQQTQYQLKRQPALKVNKTILQAKPLNRPTVKPAAARPFTPRLPAANRTTAADGSKVIVTLGSASAQRPRNEASRQESGKRTTTENGQRCDYKTVNFTDTNLDFTEFVTSVGDATWLYPGSILDLGSVTTGAYRTFNTNRHPVQLSSSLMGGAVTETVKNPTPTGVNQGRSNLITRSGIRNIPAQMSAKITKVTNKTDLSIAVYGKYKTTGVDASLSASFGRKANSETWVIDFTQIAYQAFIDDLPGAAAFRSVPAGADPAAMGYVNSVTYGRRALMIVKTSDKSTNFRAQLDAALSSPGQSGSAGAKAAYDKLTSSTDIKVLIYGGDQSSALRAIDFDPRRAVNGFTDYIQRQFRNNAMSTAVPIGYSLKLLANNDRATVKTVFTAPVRNCVPITADYHLGLTITGVKANTSDDRDNIEDYRLTVGATYKVNRTTKPFVAKNYSGNYASALQSRSGGNAAATLIHFPEKGQLHVRKGETVRLAAEGLLPLVPAGQPAAYDLTLRTSMCERSGDGCSGMVPRGGKITPINVKATVDLLTGTKQMSQFTKMTKKGYEGYYLQGDGYSSIKPVFGNGNDRPPTALAGRIWTSNGNGRSAWIYFRLELVPVLAAR